MNNNERPYTNNERPYTNNERPYNISQRQYNTSQRPYNISQRPYNISNEHLLLIDILNTMYNDNFTQIRNLQESNDQIRNLIIQILNSNNHQLRNNNQGSEQGNYVTVPAREVPRRRGRNNNPINNFRENNTTNNSSLGRIYLNNIIDSVQQIRTPINTNLRNVNLNNNNNFSRVMQSFFTPVEVYPTPTQIETATRRVRYCDIVSPKNTSCPISLTNFNDNDMVSVIRHCGHIFNTDGLNTWFRSHCTCPVCRFDIRNDNSNSSSAFSGQSQNNNASNATNASSTSSTTINNQINNTSPEERNLNYTELANVIFNGILREYGFPENFINNLDSSGNQYSQSFYDY